MAHTVTYKVNTAAAVYSYLNVVCASLKELTWQAVFQYFVYVSAHNNIKSMAEKMHKGNPVRAFI